MDQEEKIPVDYIRGFNQGYLLSRETPELSEKLSKLFPDNEIGQGFVDGRKTYLIEKMAAVSKPISIKKEDLGKEKSRDKDGFEPS